VQVQPVQPVQVQQSAPPKTQAPPDQTSLFPSDQKKAVEYQSYRDQDMKIHQWKDADMDEDDLKDWKDSWSIK
jgi:hypothetical protein